MANAIFNHKYDEAVEIKHKWIKTGETRLLWGAIVIPHGYIERNINKLGFCSLCKKGPTWHRIDFSDPSQVEGAI